MTKDNNSQVIKDQDLEKTSSEKVDVENIANASVAIALDNSQLAAVTGGRNGAGVVGKEFSFKKQETEPTQEQEQQQNNGTNHDGVSKLIPPFRGGR